MAWSVICRPAEGNPKGNGRNLGGLVVLLADGADEEEHEVTRVAFTRRRSRNPNVPFEEQLQVELEKARRAAEALTALEREYETLREEERAKAREEIRELLGPTPKGLA